MKFFTLLSIQVCMILAVYAQPNPSCGTSTLFANGQLQGYSIGTGAGGADESVLPTTSLGASTIGFGSQITAHNAVADDFTIPNGMQWMPTTATFFTYQTGSTTTSTITGMYLKLWTSQAPTTGQNPDFTDSTTIIITYNQWSGVYRITETTHGNTTRPIMSVSLAWPASFPDTLEAGTYWLEWQYAGSLASGPWAVPCDINQGNGKQRIGANWNNALDGGTGTPPVGFPFRVCGAADTIVYAGSDMTICANASANLAGKGSCITKSWTTLGDGIFNNPNLSNASYTPGVNDTTNGTVSLVYAGCGTSDTVVLTIQSIPPAPTLMASNNTPCASTQVLLTATPSPGYTSVEYLWHKNGVPVNYQNGGPGTYTVNTGTIATSIDYTVQIVYLGSTCLSQNSATTTLVVSAPNATITPTGPTSFCANDPTTLDAAIGMSNYVWKRGSTTVATNVASYIPTSSGNHNVTVTNANGCSKTSAWTNIVVKAIPTANAGPDKVVCEGSSVQIGSTNNIANTYTWSPIEFLSNPNISNPMASPTIASSYTVIVTNNSTGCSNSDIMTVTPLPLPPTPSINSNPSGNVVILTANSPNASTINWYRDGVGLYSNQTPNSSISVYHSNPTKAYTLKSKGANGCLSLASNTVNVRLNDEKGGITLVENSMQAYPNPTTDVLNVLILNEAIETGKLMLINSLGQTVFQSQIPFIAGQANLIIEMNPLAAGIYTLSFQSENANYIQKVVKE